MIGHVIIGIILLYNGNFQWCLYNTMSKSYWLFTLSRQYCKRIGWYWKLRRRQLWPLICHIVGDVMLPWRHTRMCKQSITIFNRLLHSLFLFSFMCPLLKITHLLQMTTLLYSVLLVSLTICSVIAKMCWGWILESCTWFWGSLINVMSDVS